MNYRFYIFLIALSLFGARALAQDPFNPDSPPEPSKRYALKVVANPEGAATTSGTGRYAVNTNISVSSYINADKWQLTGWTDQDGNAVTDYNGNLVGTKSSFTYKMTNKDVTLTANYTEVATSVISVSALPENAGQKFNVYVYKPDTLSTTYKEGAKASIYANSYNNWKFLYWKDAAADTIVNTNYSFSYTVPADDVHLVAHYQFSPGYEPSDPVSVKPAHKVFFTSVPANVGSFSKTSGFTAREESTYSVTAYNPTNWTFVSWTDQDGNVLFDGSNVASAVMGKEDVHLIANYRFNPNNPNNPSTPTTSRLSLYGQTVELYHGQSTLYPIYLENTSGVTAITVSMAVPDGIIVDKDNITTTGRTSGYTITSTLEEDTLTFTLSGGTAISGNNGAFVHLPISVSETLADGLYDFNFTANTVTLADETTKSATVRNGKIKISTLGDEGLAALFLVDQLMNRVQFTNISTEGCKSFSWSFGDGYFSQEVSPLHIYSEPGSYTVVLAAEGEVKNDQMEQVITVADPSTWTSGGDYSLNSGGSGIRNFVSLDETISLLSQCRPIDPVVVTVSEGGNYTIDITSAEALAEIQTLQEKFSTAGKTLKFATPADKTASSLSFNVSADAEYLQAVLAFGKSLQLDNVKLIINNVEINPAILFSIGSETVCAGTPTTEIELTSLGNGESLTVEWTAIVSEGSTLSGYELSGTGDLPSMQINNSGTQTQTVTYNISYKLDGVVLYSASHALKIRPLLTGQTLELSSPANGAVVGFGNNSLRWNNLNSLATNGYTVRIQRMDDGSAEKTFSVTTNSYTLNCVPGATYSWSVTAHGECDDITSETRTFTVRKQADLMVESVSAPAENEALKDLKVTAVIKNVGDETTVNSSWYDALYYSTKNTGISGATRVATLYRNQALAVGESYTVEFSVKAPDSSLGQIYYYVKADYNGYETESDETNNVAVSEAMTIAESYMNADDYEALKVLHNALNGEIWSKKWNIATNAINSTAWPGITFDQNGRVTAINLASNNLSGTLPEEGFVLPMLTSISLRDNNIRGNVAKFVAGCPALKTIDLSYCHIRELTEALPETITSLNLSYQDNGSDLSFLTMQTWQMGTKIDNVELTSLMQYNHSAGDFSAHPRMNIRTVSGSYLGSLSYDNGYKLSLSGDYKQASGVEVRIESVEGVASYTRLRGTLSWISGDSNADGAINVGDAQNTLNRILSRQSGNFNFVAANTYGTDEIINVQDVVATINKFIVEETPAEAKGNRIDTDDREYDGSVYATTTGLYVDLDSPMAALDITLTGVKATQLAMQLNRNDFQMHTHAMDNGVRVVIISPSGKEIGTGLSRLLRFSVKDAEVQNVEAVDIEASTMFLEIAEGEPTGIDAIEVDDSKADVYDLHGRKQNNDTALPAGVYIKNGRKVIIK